MLWHFEEFHSLENGKQIDTKIWINDQNFEYWINAKSVLNSLKKVVKDITSVRLLFIIIE